MSRNSGHPHFAFPAVALSVAAALATSYAAHGQVADDTVLAEVQVTASRIQRTGFEAPTPTTMVGAELFEARAAVRVSQVLFDIPALRPTATAVPFSASAGGAYANLRNLNPGAPTQTATRTLVLVDGRRIVPNTATGLVDLNSIPTSLIKRVEIVTGGASAAWGSDAVAGVTNFILKDSLDGFEGTAQYGTSQHGDFDETNLSLAWGTGFAGGRGQVMLAGEYSELDDIATYGDRSWGDDQWGWVSGSINGTQITRIAQPGVVSSGVAYGGVLVAANGAPLPLTGPTAALRGIQFGFNGAVQPFTYGTFLSNNQMVGGSGPVLSTLGNLGSPVERKNLFGRTTFEFTDSLKGFVELAYAQADSVTNTQPMYSPNGDPVYTIRNDNPFLPGSVRAIMSANALTSVTMGRVTPEFGVYSVGESGTEVKRIAAGLDGDLAGSWSWKAYVGAGDTEYYDRVPNNVRQANLRAALDVVAGPNGTPICRINSTAPADIAIVSAANYQGRGAAAGCVPANPFGTNSFTPDVVGYVIGQSYAESTLEQRTAGASVQGDLFDTWAGTVSMAGGVDYREESVDQIADPVAQFTTPAFQTGGWQFGNRRPLVGSYDVTEFFAEALVPLAKDAFLAKSLDLNAAVRSTDYSTSGNVVSWKAGLTYEPITGLRLRANRSRDIRAANLVELYTPGVSIVGAIVDYGRPGNPSSSVPTTTIGNPELEPELADTTTIGVVWEPSFASGLSMSVDYYDIDLQDAIGSLGGQNIVSGCYGRSPFTAPQPELCDLISRDPTTGVITNVNNQTLNLAYIQTSGVDMEVDYRFALSSIPGTWSVRLLGTYLNNFDENNGIVTVDRAGQLGNSQWRVTGSTTWATGPVSLFLQLRYIDAAHIDNTYGPNDIYDNHVPSRIYVNGSAQYTLFDSEARGRLQVFGNINNILDQDPPIIPSASAAPGQTTLAPDYDKIGRYFSLGLRYHF